MPASLSWTVDERDQCIVVTIQGPLSLRDTPKVHRAVLKCLAEQPRALLIDLSRMTFQDDIVLALFTAVTRQAARWPGTPVLLCGPDTRAADLFSKGRYGALVVHPSVSAALEAGAGRQVSAPTISDRLLPEPGAPRRGRDLVTEACAAWNIPTLAGPASLVVSELVANGVEHAGTTLTLQIARRSRYLHIAVRDGSSHPPAIGPTGAGLARRGRGLQLVEAESAHWGWLPTRDGKVVWAVLDVPGQPSSNPPRPEATKIRDTNG